MTLTSRAHFFGVAAMLMRQILVDHARRQRAGKRGGGVTMLTLDEASPAAWTSSVDLLALDEALDALSAIDPRQCRVVELRFFAGLTIDEVAEALGVSPAIPSALGGLQNQHATRNRGRLANGNQKAGVASTAAAAHSSPFFVCRAGPVQGRWPGGDRSSWLRGKPSTGQSVDMGRKGQEAGEAG